MKGGGAQGAGSRTLPSSNSSPVHSAPAPPHASKQTHYPGEYSHPAIADIKSGGRQTTTTENSEPISSAIVKYNYQAQQLDELSLVKGSRVMILEKSGDGWWRGQYGNKVGRQSNTPTILLRTFGGTNMTLAVWQVGWFPSNYTQEEIDDPHTYCMAENVLDVMVALYAFKAQADTELSFSKGDRLEVWRT